MATNPTYDSRQRFCLTLATAIVVRSATTPGSESVLTTMPPKFVLATRPLTFAPARIGTSLPPTRPMRRLKYGIMSLLTTGPNWKMSTPSRKNVRFSGKNSGKRVRFV